MKLSEITKVQENHRDMQLAAVRIMFSKKNLNARIMFSKKILNALDEYVYLISGPYRVQIHIVIKMEGIITADLVASLKKTGGFLITSISTAALALGVQLQDKIEVFFSKYIFPMAKVGKPSVIHKECLPTTQSGSYLLHETKDT